MSLAPQPTSTTRVLTQNLLISASEAETDKEVWEGSVEDISTLINVVALYDDVFVLGRTAAFDSFGRPSNLMGFLKDEQIIKTQTLDKVASEDISQRAKKHLAVYLDELDDKDRRNIEKFEPLLRSALSPSEAFYGLFYGSDHVEQVQVGDLWLRTVPDNVDPLELLEREAQYARGGTFLIRSFLYLAYSHHLEVPFTPDSARSHIIQKILRKEDMFFRTRILKVLQEDFEKYPEQLSDARDYRQITSPFAAVVFERCNGSRSRLAMEIKKMRDQMQPTRERLKEIEWHALWDGRAEGIKAQAKLERVLKEINQAFGPRPGLLTWETGLALREDTGKIIDNPMSWKAWLDGLSNLSAGAAARLIYRRPVAEIHQLQKKLPGPRALKKIIYELFGELRT